VFVAPISVILIAYASVFPKEPQALIPALQSYWLWLHVTMAALAEGLFAVAFGAALAYLLATWRKEEESHLGAASLEGIFYFLCALLAWVLLALALKWAGYEVVVQAGMKAEKYRLPPLVGPAGAAPGSAGSLFGLPLPLVAGPAWVKGKNLNTLIYALTLGIVVYRALVWAMGRSFRAAAPRSWTK
jgi:hypothetical protein